VTAGEHGQHRRATHEEVDVRRGELHGGGREEDQGAMASGESVAWGRPA
jgi:hypothetical protein